MAREYWYMQLRRWLMRSSVKSVIRSSLSGQKRLLKPSKPGAEGRLRASIPQSSTCYKVRFFVAAGANWGVWAPPVATPFVYRLHLRPSTRDLTCIGGREAGGLGLGEVLGGIRVRRVHAAEDGEIARMQTGEVLRIEDADRRQPLLERPLRDLDGGCAAGVLGHGGEHERIAVGERPLRQRRRRGAGGRRRPRGRHRSRCRRPRQRAEDGSGTDSGPGGEVRRDDRLPGRAAARRRDRDERAQGGEHEHGQRRPERIGREPLA